MSPSRPPLSPEVREMLEQERKIPPVSAPARARALARARAALVAGIDRRPAPAPVPRMRWAVAVAGVCVLSAAVASAAYEIRARLSPRESTHPVAHPVAHPVLAVTPPPPPVPSPPIAEMSPPPTRVLGKPASAQSDAAAAQAELRLLRQARAAVAREDHAAALPLITEHARRFKNGRLVEEREALRVKALAGLGRTDEARRVAAAFRLRFPRSVLLPAISQIPASEP